jgi:hypothetical protein
VSHHIRGVSDVVLDSMVLMIGMYMMYGISSYIVLLYDVWYMYSSYIVLIIIIHVSDVSYV